MEKRKLKKLFNKEFKKNKKSEKQDKFLDIYFNNKDEIYSKFSGSQNYDLNKEFKDYLLSHHFFVEKVSLYFLEMPLEEDRKRIIKDINIFLTDEIINIKKLNRFNLLKNIIFISLGAIFIVLSYFSSDNGSKVFPEIYMVLGWFLIWESANSFFINRPKNSFKLFYLLSMYYASKEIQEKKA